MTEVTITYCEKCAVVAGEFCFTSHPNRLRGVRGQVWEPAAPTPPETIVPQTGTEGRDGPPAGRKGKGHAATEEPTP